MNLLDKNKSKQDQGTMTDDHLSVGREKTVKNYNDDFKSNEGSSEESDERNDDF